MSAIPAAAANLDLGVIGNCQVGALIDRYGRYVWAGLPRLDGDAVFCSLLRSDVSQGPGFFVAELAGCTAAEQHYERNTAVLETVLHDGSGAAIRILDFCPRFRQFGRNFRPMMFVRIIEPLAGHAVVRVRLRPAADYGSQEPVRRAGSNHLRYENGAASFRVTTDMSLAAMLEERPVVLRERISFVLAADEPVTDSIGSLAQRLLEETRQYWLDWVRNLAVPFEWQDAVIRAAITLKLCSFEDTGAVIAAMTTSIPEAANSGRNWDYRYCWLRDSYFTIQALNRLGATRTMEGYLRYIANVVAAAAGMTLQPVYGISGDGALTERTIAGLPGYRGMGPVRVGNQAYAQQQHDVYGAVILAATQIFFDRRLAQVGGVSMFHQLEPAAERCWQLYDQPDAGLWEYRGRTRVHTFSSVMCWAGTERLGRIAVHLGLAERAEFWSRRAAEMQARIMAAAWDPQQRCFTEAWGQPAVDASVLLLAELGFVRPDDPRFVSSVQRAEQVLRRGPYLMRYVDDDGFGAPENAFNICTFWFIGALAAIGRRDEARDLFDNMLARRNSVGLLSEDLELRTGELWGNYPQTYSLVGIINAAVRLSRSWEEAL